MDIHTGDTKLVSTGNGTTTCSYFEYPETKKIIYASTHLGSTSCPEKPDLSEGYVWKLYPDFDIFKATIGATGLERLTSSPDYDAEATFAFDGSKIIYTSMASGDLDLWTMLPDGSNKKQITDNNAANFGPFFFSDGKRIIFSSNMHDKKRGDFDLYAINTDGTNLERITYFNGFDGFPMFSRDGKYLVFASNRNQKKRGDTNIFLAEWH